MICERCSHSLDAHKDEHESSCNARLSKDGVSVADDTCSCLFGPELGACIEAGCDCMDYSFGVKGPPW